MRKLTRLFGASLALLCAFSFGSPGAGAGPMCTATCSSGTTLQCCLASGTCTAGSGTIDCNGTLLTCGPIDAYNACRNACENERQACSADCNFQKTCYSEYCYPAYRACLSDCGSRPTTNIGC
jgi:hypothetical protein